MKRIFTALFVAAASYAASADLLYWMIDQTGADPQYEFTYAQIKAQPSGGGEAITLTAVDAQSGLPAGDTIWANEVSDDDSGPVVGKSVGLMAVDLSGLSSTDYSFFIELYSMATGHEVKVGQSEIAAYSQLTASIYEQGLGLPSLEKAWNPTITNVPEPTSGVLMLFGLAALGLRRRRALGC